MEVININNKRVDMRSSTETMQRCSNDSGDPSERQPCWQITFTKGDIREESFFTFKCEDEKDGEEYTLKADEVGDVNDNKVWEQLISVDFAVNALNSFKKEASVEVLRNILR